MILEFFTVEEVADMLKVSQPSVYNWVNDGVIESVRIGRTVRIPKHALEAFVQKHTRPALDSQVPTTRTAHAHP